MEKLGQTITLAIVSLIVSLIIAYPIMLLWNSCLVLAIPALVKITYWQAFGLKILFSMLFSSNTSTSN